MIHRYHLCFALLFLFQTGTAQTVSVNRLVCENGIRPAGIEKPRPHLGWQLVSGKRGVMQSAYRILVADDSVLLLQDKGNVWDSRKVNSSQSIQQPYKGKTLQPAKTYYWKVMIWDQQQKPTAWSAISSWQMGLWDKAHWGQAQWIGYEAMPDSLYLVPAAHQKGPASWAGVRNVLPLLRSTIDIPRRIKKATAFICGLGHFELSANGQKIGDHFLDPGWTKYDKEAQYVSFDMTAELQTGKNVLGVMLGNGFYFIPGERYRKLTGAYGYPKMILRMFVEYADGSTQDFVSNENWKTAEGPITFSSIYGGEDYDARLEQAGWNKAGFNDDAWRRAVVVKGVPVLYHQLQPPLKVFDVFRPIKETRIREGVHVFDLGQNASGIPAIVVKGQRGDTVRMIPGELTKEDGTVSQRATGSPVYFQYVLKGNGIEHWQPRFSYYGFRYVQVEGCVLDSDSHPDKKPQLVSITGLHIRNAAEQAGSFTASFDLFNQVFQLINWSIRSNMASILTDCPHREKLGWLEQVHLMGHSIHYNYDLSNFFRKTLRDMRTAQDTGRLVPEYVPEYVKMPFMNGIFMDSPEWGSASIIMPWYLYLWYGDKTVLEENYEMMRRYLAHLKSRAGGHILNYGLSDWYDLGPEKPGLAQLTPMGLTGTAIYYYDLTLLQKIAGLLGKEEDRKSFAALAAKVKTAFNKKFYNPSTGQYGSGSQTSNAMALYMDLVPAAYRKTVLDEIIQDIRSRNNSITAGDVGFRYLLQVLQKSGRSDVIFDMNSRTDVPGYGYQLKKGATALTESWQALPTVSNNHLMLGHLMEWFYSGLAGIGQESSSVAYRHISIHPQLVAGVDQVKASHASAYGPIVSHWKKMGNSWELDIQVPCNTRATLYLAALPGSIITESGRKVHKRKDIRWLGYANGKAKLNISSGHYHFRIGQAFSSKISEP